MHDPSSPFISVITSTYNCKSTIEGCLQSVFNQSFMNYEYLVVDGASSDGTTEIISKYKDRLALFISEKDSGVYEAWNKACQHIRGEWILFLGGDDQLADRNVLNDLSIFLSDVVSNIKIAYGDVLLVESADGTRIKRMGEPPECYVHKFTFGKIKLPPHQGVFHRRSLFAGKRPFDTSYKISADAKLVYSNFGTDHAIYLPRLVAKMRSGGLSTVNTRAIDHAMENIRLFGDLGIKLSWSNYVAIWCVALFKRTVSLAPEKLQSLIISFLKRK